MLAMQADDYFIAGLAISLSLVYEGPAPRFLAKELFNALIGEPDRIGVSLKSQPDSPMKNDLNNV